MLFDFSLRLDDLKPNNPLLNPLHITSQLHYKEDKSLQKATVECHNPKMPLRRSDSSKYRKPSATIRNNYQNCFSSEDILLKPGSNDLILDFTATEKGAFKLGQISITVEGKLEFLSNALIGGKVGFEVVTQGVNVYLNKVEPKKDLVAGLEHAMELVVTCGSTRIEEVRPSRRRRCIMNECLQPAKLEYAVRKRVSQSKLFSAILYQKQKYSNIGIFFYI